MKRDQIQKRWEQSYSSYYKFKPVWDRSYPSPILTSYINKSSLTGNKILSLGCGSGTNEIYLAEIGYDVIGVDISHSAISICKNRTEESNLSIKWICHDILDLKSNPDICNKPFDLILDRGCYHHMRYISSESYIETIKHFMQNNSFAKIVIISCNSSFPPGVTKQMLETDFGDFDILLLENIKLIDEKTGVMRDEWILECEAKKN